MIMARWREFETAAIIPAIARGLIGSDASGLHSLRS